MKPKLPKIKLKLVRERLSNYEPANIMTPQCAEKFLGFMRELPEEQFVAIHLDARHNAIGLQVVSHGTASASLVHPREVFKGAMLSNAHAILVAHNHPTGDNSTASREDIETTENLVKAGKILGISVLDHLVIGDSPALSLREHNPRIWEAA